jgi:hypothetical protein
MVFDDRFEARQWALSYCGIVYECEVLNPSDKGPFLSSRSNNSWYVLNYLKIFTDLFKRYKKRTHLYGYGVKGTVFCDAVKLIASV